VRRARKWNLTTRRVWPPWEAQGRTQSMLRAAAYSSLRLQSRVLRSQSGNGIWRGQDSGVSIVAFVTKIIADWLVPLHLGEVL
jgi:hypothetical protein